MSWASAIRSLEHDVELIQDDQMYKFFEGGLRGGMTFINKHHVETNVKTKTNLLYIDINNLYGWALSEKLPCGEFKWIKDEEEMQNIKKICETTNLDGKRGYTLEVDLEISKEIQDFLDDLPVAPEAGCPPGSKVKKLLLSHKSKEHYVVHGRLLKLWLELGVKVTKIHRIVEYRQENIFAKYIDNNTRKRAAANNDFDKDFFKLKNNSLYGKTVENLKKRMQLMLCKDEKRFQVYTSSPYFQRSIKIADDLIAVHMMKEEITLDRPSYIGQAVLDLSKLRMYNLQYRDLEKYRKSLKCKIDIVAGDTDSFFLQCHNVDLSTLLKNMKEDGLLDTSNYPVGHELHSVDCANKIGLFKDESKGVGYIEWIFLRPKCYSLLKNDETESMKSKGVNLRGSNIRHENYKNVYINENTIHIEQKNIRSINHQLFTIVNTKVALKCLDDKRCWIGKNQSVAYGHKNQISMTDTPINDIIPHDEYNTAFH
jgi:hypothetical protein